MFIYVLSLSLQIAGSVLLFVNCLGKTRQRIIDEYFGQSTIADNDNNDYATIKSKDVIICVKSIYAKRISFLYLAVGYLLSIYSEKNEGQKLLLIIVIATAVTLVLIEIIAANIISRHIYSEDMKVHYSELPENTARTISIKDMDAMMDSILR